MLGYQVSNPSYPGGAGYPGSYPPSAQQQQSGYPYHGQVSQPGYPPQSSYPPPPGFSPAYTQSTASYPAYPQTTYPASSPYPTAPVSNPSTSHVSYAASSYPNQVQASYPSQCYPSQSYLTHLTPGTMSAKPVTEQYVPSIYPQQPFDPRADAEVLLRAMKGFGTDEKALIKVLCKRTTAQRVQITQTFKALYGKDLQAKIKSETSGNFEKVLVALTLPREEFLARELYKAMDGLGTKESTLIEVLCTSTNQEIRDINFAYQKLFGRHLEKDIRGDTSGSLMHLLVSLAQGCREEDASVDLTKVRNDAARLLHAGEARFGTEESTFNSILATRSWAHLKQLLIEYRSITGNSLEKAVSAEFSFYVEKGMLGILQCAENRSAYFAKRLHNAMKGLGTDDSTLQRIIISRSDVDLGSIKLEYQKMFSKTLQSDVAGDTSGDYKHALLSLIGL